MTDLPGRIKAAVTASVADAEPPPGLLEAVHTRYRRGRRMRAAIGAAAAMAVLAGALTLAARPWQSSPAPVTGRHHAHAALFPGGGRVLLASGGTLRWVFPDGHTQWLPGSFDGASVTAGEILAWKFTGPAAGYYTMTLSGGNQRHVLPMAWNRRLSVIQAQLSPDRSMLGYVRQDMASPTSVTDTLWIENLATGRSVSAGPVSDGFAWAGPRTLVATSATGHELSTVNTATGARLPSSPPQIRRWCEPMTTRLLAAGRWPSSPPTGRLRQDGPAALLSGSPRPGTCGGLSSRRRARTPGPPSSSWRAPPGRRICAANGLPARAHLGTGTGLFALQTGAGELPGSWLTYVGASGNGGVPRRGQLSTGIAYGQNGVMFSPGRTVLALEDGGSETLVPVPRPQCQAAHGSPCLEFRPLVFPKAGAIQAWLP